MTKRSRIGDIIEIKTTHGLAYAQVTHVHPRFGALLRVLRGFSGTRPKSLGEVVKADTQFQTFFPLQAAISRKIVIVAGNEPVPNAWKAFPVFRSGLPNPSTQKITEWFLWDGERSWRVGRLTPDQQKLPIKEIVNDTLLIARLESGWTAESDAKA